MAELKELKVLLGTTLTRVPKLLEYESVPEPLWADDTGRNSREGDFSGTFIGYFTNLTISIGETTQEEYTTLCSMFQKSTAPVCEISYQREDTGNLYQETFYGTALKAKKDRYSGKYKSFQIQLTATQKRTYDVSE